MTFFICGKRRHSLISTQLLLGMKLTALLITVALLQVSAKGLSQKVTYTAKNVPLEKIFPVIEQQTGYSFFYNNQDITKSRPVTIELRNVPLEKALAEILKNQPLVFDIQGKTIVISAKPATPVLQAGNTSLHHSDPPIDIHGR